MALWATPTGIEAYNLYRTQEWFTTERYMEQLTGKFEGNRITDVGHAIHSLIEYRISSKRDKFKYEDILFDSESVQNTLVHIPDHGHAELKGTLEVSTPHGIITIYGRSDNVHGLTVTDYKTSKSEADPQGFFMSYQWRIYLEMFKCKAFEYEFIKYRDPEQLKREMGKNKPVTLEYDSRLTLYTYPDIQKDIARLCTEYIEFLYQQKLQHLIGAE